MLLSYFIYPEIDPVIFSIGPLSIRWYSLAYIAGIFFGAYWVKRIIKHSPFNITKEFVDASIMPIILGIVIGGRLGYVLLYQPAFYLSHPLEIFKVWQGGMSFHGGFVGYAISVYYYSKKNNLKPFAVIDAYASGAGIGLFLGRMANFINGELWGRPTEVPWAMIFPHVDNLPRHPSQIYEALLEGLLIFIIINLAITKTKILYRPGYISGLFCILYATFRSISEIFRIPDGTILGLTSGQAYSVPLFIVGVFLIFISKPSKVKSGDN